jgi:hypothetical protein
MNIDRVTEILSRTQISQVWAALGGGPMRYRRGKAFWRGGDGLNVALDDEKGAWFDHARAEGGGVLDLVEKARDCDRQAALRWLAAFAGIPLDDRPLSLAERRDWAKARAEARLLARAALWWWRERIGELEDQKRAAFHAGGMEIDILAPVARELYRFQGLSPDAVVEHYLRARTSDPHATRELVRIGEMWERACRAVVLAVLGKPEAEVRCAA